MQIAHRLPPPDTEDCGRMLQADPGAVEVAGAHNPLRRAGILLDRDGTLIVDHGYVGSVDRVELIPGAAEAVAAFNRAGIPVAVITNQSGVARGYYSTEDVETVHRHIADRLAEHGAYIDLFLFCPDHPDGTVEPYVRRSADRKPGPGMALAAADTLGLDLATSWVVGDRMEDMGLASAVGASGIFLGPDGCDHHGLRAFPDLAAAADFILQHIDQGDGTAELSLLGRPPLTVRRKFPVESYGQARSYWRAYRSECQRAALSVDPQQIDRAVTVLLDAYTRSALIFACGNGGSAAIANHLQCDHVKGMRTATDLRPRAVSLSANIELIMAIANDLSYAEVFSYQLESQARPGDVLIAISSSGRSENIVRAVRWARDSGLHTIALTGFDGGEARRLAEISIHVRSANYGVVEDTHQAVMHAMAQFMRQSRMTPDTIARHSF